MKAPVPSCLCAFDGMPMDVARRIRAGIPAASVDDIAAFMGVRLEALAVHLGFSVDRILDLVARNATLESWEAGRLYYVAAAYFEAVAVLESEIGAVEWLRERVPALGSVAPLSLLDTPPGFQLVIDTLGQIKYGVFA